ncbi:sugar transporter [Pyrenophora seminiperda CCB06]|uniref:Sugar transporter n=1 Tax=Pyrenophora seminiperda CCB06 TaxID=1302712 RepID=A0A3M7ME88_9PLEO|nr:sugar transporter [Pyrenophora seminiperda CCB06]
MVDYYAIIGFLHDNYTLNFSKNPEYTAAVLSVSPKAFFDGPTSAIQLAHFMETSQTQIQDKAALCKAQKGPKTIQTELSAVGSENSTMEEVESQVLGEKAASYENINGRDEADGQELYMKAALHLQGDTCTVQRPHKCRLLRTHSKGTRSKISHLFWNHQYPSLSKRIGPYGFRISNHRLLAFRDIQKQTGSKLGNGKSGLRTSIDADGVVTNHDLITTTEEATTKGKPTESWGLMRERFQQRSRQQKKERAREKERVMAFRDYQLYDRFLRLDPMRRFDMEALEVMYRKGYMFLSKVDS